MIRRIAGSPATGKAGLARARVSGRSRVPKPAASTSAARGRAEITTRSSGHAEAVRTAFERRRADVLGEDQDLVSAAEAARHHQGLERQSFTAVVEHTRGSRPARRVIEVREAEQEV